MMKCDRFAMVFSSISSYILYISVYLQLSIYIILSVINLNLDKKTYIYIVYLLIGTKYYIHILKYHEGDFTFDTYTVLFCKYEASRSIPLSCFV